MKIADVQVLFYTIDDLFLHWWNHFFVALIKALFAGALWIVLLLWAALFDVIGIEVFGDIFSELLFVYVVTGAAVGFEIALGRESEWIVASSGHGWTGLHAFGEDGSGRYAYLGRLLIRENLETAQSIASALRDGRFESVPSEHRDLSIDGMRFRLVPP